MVAIEISYRAPEGTAVIHRNSEMPSLAWLELQRSSREQGGAAVAGDSVEIPWHGFLAMTQVLRHLQKRYGFRSAYTNEARDRLFTYVREANDLRSVQNGQELHTLSTHELTELLISNGWDTDQRSLTTEQVRDARGMLQLSNGANFSVPGSGKTTVALAVHLAGVPTNSSLLVVAPKNAFLAWDEVLEDCLINTASFVRLTGGEASIRRALSDSPRFAVISYAQLINAEGPVTEYLHRESVHLILDESHRIKSGHWAQSARAVLRIGPLAARRDILTGTPMPQSTNDLIPQFDFLWPAHGIGTALRRGSDVRSTVAPLYVRTTKNELGLPAPLVEWVPVHMSNPQRLLYALLRDDILRRFAAIQPGQLPFRSRTSVMRLLQVAIDPFTAVAGMVNSGFSLPGSDFAEVCRRVIEEDWSPRMVEVERRVRTLVADGQKVVVWAPFVSTIERLTSRFEDLGAMMIHGGVPAGDDADDDTREGIIRRFHSDSRRMVLVANPAAGGEGISLHQVCHNAVYIGRTYNAAHYLQSRDRIHRLGLSADTTTRVTIVEHTAPNRVGSIDLSVRRRLQAKVAAMSAVLDDRDLRQLALESDDADPLLDDGITRADLEDLILELRRGDGDGAR